MRSKQDIALITDVSVNPRLRLGAGAYLVIPGSLLEASPGTIDNAELEERIMVRRFEDTSSSRLELQTVLWALQEQPRSVKRTIRLYTDSQCVSGLLGRRPRLMAGNFISKKTKRPLKNASLYRAFYELHDAIDFQVIKLEGHTRASGRDAVRRIFSCVDKVARKALREWMNEAGKAAEVPTGEADKENWCVYVLKCSNNSLYTGMTSNIERRLKEHEQGRGSKYVRSRKPFELVKTIPCKTAGEARRLEYALKKLRRKEKIEVLELLLGPL